MDGQDPGLVCPKRSRVAGHSKATLLFVHCGHCEENFEVNNARDVLVVLKCEQYNCPHCGWRLRLPLSVGDVESLRKWSNKLLHIKVPKELTGGNIRGRSVKDDGRLARSKVGKKRSRETDVSEGEAPRLAAPPQPQVQPQAQAQAQAQPSTIDPVDRSGASEHKTNAIQITSVQRSEIVKVMQTEDLQDSLQAADSRNENNPGGIASRSIQVEKRLNLLREAQHSDKPEQHGNHSPIIGDASGVTAVVSRSTELQPQTTIKTRRAALKDSRFAAIAQKEKQDNPLAPTTATAHAQAPKQKSEQVMNQNVQSVRNEASREVVNVVTATASAEAVDHRTGPGWFTPQQWMAYMDHLSKQMNVSNMSNAIKSQGIHNFNLNTAQNGFQAAWINNLGLYNVPADQARLAFIQQLWRVQNSPAVNDQVRQYALMMLHQMQGQNLNQQTIQGNVQIQVVHHKPQLAMQSQVQAQGKPIQDAEVQIKAVPKSVESETAKVDVSRKSRDVSHPIGSPQNNNLIVHTEMQQDAAPVAAEGKNIHSDMAVDTPAVEPNVGKGKLEVVAAGEDNEELVQQDAAPVAAEGKNIHSDMAVDTPAVEPNVGREKLEVVAAGEDNEELVQQHAGPAAAEGKNIHSDMAVDTPAVEPNVGKGKLEVVAAGKDNEELVQQDAGPVAAEGKNIHSDMAVDSPAVEPNVGKGKLEVVAAGEDNEELVQQDAGPVAAEGENIHSDMAAGTPAVEPNVGKGKLEVVAAGEEKASERLEGIEALSIVLQQAAEDGMDGIDAGDIVDLNGYSIKYCGAPKVIYVNSSTGSKLYLQSVLIDDRLDWDSARRMLQETGDNDGGQPFTLETTHQNTQHISDSVVVLVSQDEDGRKQKGGQTSDSASSEFFIDLTGYSDEEDQTSPAEQPAMPLGNTAGSNKVQVKSGFYLVEQVAWVEGEVKTQNGQRGAILVLRSTSDTGTPAFQLYNPGSRQGHMCDDAHATELLSSSLPVAVDDCEAVWKKQFEEWENNPCSTIHVLHGDFIDNWVPLTKAIAMCGALKGDCQAKLRGVKLFATEGPSSNLVGLLVPATAAEEVVAALLELPQEDNCIYLQD